MSRNRTRARGGNRDVSQVALFISLLISTIAFSFKYGIFGIPSDIDSGLGGSVDEDDEDLEAELMALAGGGGAPKRPPRKAAAAPAHNLDAMVAASMKDIPDDELSGDEDDPDLLSELHEIAGNLIK